jgi:hypothetical protein
VAAARKCWHRSIALETPGPGQEALQETMQDNVGSFGRGNGKHAQDDRHAQAARGDAPVKGNRVCNPGIRRSTWADHSRCRKRLPVCDRAKENRGGHFATTIPTDDKLLEFSFVVRKGQGRDGDMQIAREPIPPMPGHLKAIIEEMK